MIKELCKHSKEPEFTSVTHWNEECQKEVVLGRLCLECGNDRVKHERAKKRALRALPKSISIHGRRWFDKVNGNTYFSAYALVDGKQYENCITYEYGYGDQYVDSMCKRLETYGVIPERPHYSHGGQPAAWHWIRDVLGIEWFYDACDVSRKRDL